MDLHSSFRPAVFFSFFFGIFIAAPAEGGPIVDEILRRVDCNVKCATSCAASFQLDRNLQSYLGCTAGCRNTCQGGHSYGDDGLVPPVNVAPGEPSAGGPGHPYGDDGLEAPLPRPSPPQDAPPTLPEPSPPMYCTSIWVWSEEAQDWVNGCGPKPVGRPY